MSTPRPGSVTGAVLAGYVEAGLLVLGGAFVIVSGWLASSFLGPEFGRAYTVIGLFVIAMGALYIIAARRLQSGRSRSLLITLAIITVVVQVNTALWSNLASWPSTVLLIGLLPPLVALGASLRSSTSRWVAAHH